MRDFAFLTAIRELNQALSPQAYSPGDPVNEVYKRRIFSPQDIKKSTRPCMYLLKDVVPLTTPASEGPY